MVYVGSVYVFGFGSCLVFLWWVFPTGWLSEGQSVPHLLSSVLQVWAGCVGASSSMCTRFWGFSLALVQLFVLSNFLTIYLYFQVSPGLTWCGFPSLLHLLLFLYVGVSFVGGFPLPGGILVFPASTHSFFMVGLLWSMGVVQSLPWFALSLVPVVSDPFEMSRDEVRTLPGGFTQTLVCAHTTQSLSTLL